MTAKDALRLLALMTAAIPSAAIPADKLAATASVWARLFARHEYADVESAALKVLEGHVWSTLPTPGSVLQAMRLRQSAGEPDALEAWHEVLTAIERHGYCDKAGALASMSPRTAYVAERMGWAELCRTPEDVTSVIRGQFCKLYEASRERTPDVRMLTARTDAPTAVEAAHILTAIEAKGG